MHRNRLGSTAEMTEARRNSVSFCALFLSSHHKLGSPQQCPLDLRVGEGTDCLPRRLGIACRSGVSRFQRSVPMKNIENVRVRHAVERALAQNGFNLSAFFGCTA